MDTTNLNEEILPDDYPVYGDYLYVCDGKVIRCNLMEGTVRDMKRDIWRYTGVEAKEIRRCDIEGRRKQLEAKDGK